MSEKKLPVGYMGWVDLTVKDAPRLRDFYSRVVGWKAEALSMGDHDDYLMQEPVSGKNVAGVCHAKGENAGLPAVWLVYFVVESLDQSLERCVAEGGKLVAGPRNMPKARFAVIEDPSGAPCALYEDLR